jgi:ribosomal protein S19
MTIQVHEETLLTMIRKAVDYQERYELAQGFTRPSALLIQMLELKQAVMKGERYIEVVP